MIDNLELKSDCKILNLGCGNAEFSEDMYDDGYFNIYNIDIAENVIEFMGNRNLHREQMKCNFLFQLKLWMLESLNIQILHLIL